MKPIKHGSTDVSITIRIIQDAGATSPGEPDETIVSTSTNLAFWYRREGGTKAPITPISNLVTLDAAHSDGGLLHIDDGEYRLDIPDAAFTSGADCVIVGGVADNVVVLTEKIPLVAYDPQDSTTWNAWQDQYDGTGLAGDTYPATQAQVNSIGAASGGALNFEATEDNQSSAIKGISKVGTQTGAYTNTEREDGVYHSIAAATNDIDWIYGFDVGTSRSAVEVTWKGYLNGNGDEMKIQAYDFVGTDWETIATITGKVATTNDTIVSPLLSKHTGTGSDIGKVYIRFETLSTTPATLACDLCQVAAVYSQAGIANGSTVTLSATTANSNLIGNNWTLAMGGQSITGTYVEGATVTGTGTGSSTTFVDCHISAGASIPAGTYIRCRFAGTSGSPVTESGTGEYVFIDCVSAVTGSGTPYFNFAGAGGAVGVNIRRWAGGINWTGDSNVTLSHEVLAGGGQTIANGGGNVELRGICRSVSLTASASETIQFIGITGPITLTDDTSTAPTINLYGVASSLSDSSTLVTLDATSKPQSGDTYGDLTSAHSEPAGVPAANETPLDKLGYLFMALRNQVDVTATNKTFYDDGGVAEWKKALSDAAGTYTENEAASP